MTEELFNNIVRAVLVMIGGVIGYAIGAYVAPIIPGSFDRLAIMMSCILMGAGVGLGISTRIFR